MIEASLKNLKRFIAENADISVFYPGATDQQIFECEVEIEMDLPDEHKEFLRSFNGGFISIAKKKSDPDWDEGFSSWNSNTFLSIDEIKKTFELQRRAFKERKWEGPWPFVPLCRTYSQEFLVFSPSVDNGPRFVMNSVSMPNPSDWPVVFPSFVEMLDTYIESAGELRKKIKSPGIERLTVELDKAFPPGFLSFYKDPLGSTSIQIFKANRDGDFVSVSTLHQPDGLYAVSAWHVGRGNRLKMIQDRKGTGLDKVIGILKQVFSVHDTHS